MRKYKIFMKGILLKNKFLSYRFYELGWINRIPMGQLAINWIVRCLFGINSGCNYSVHFSSRVMSPGKITINGRPLSPLVSMAVSGGCYIQATNGIEIGEGTIWAANVAIISANHDINRPDGHWVQCSPVVIGRNCWIGANAVILPGVVLGDNTVVGAGSVVTKSFEEGFSVLVGAPARRVSKIIIN